MTSITRPMRSRGVTLVEVLITSAISAVAFLGVLSLSYFNNIFQFKTEQRAGALLLAEEVMEETLRLPFGELEASETRTVPFSRAKLGESTAQTATIEIELWDEFGNEIPNGPPADAFSFVRIQVTVTFVPRSETSTVVRLVSWRVP